MSRAPANDAVRIVHWLRNLELTTSGPLLACEDGLWLLCSPAGLVSDPVTAAALLSGRGPIDPTGLGECLGARSVVALNDEQLARWWRDLTLLRASQGKADRLARDGVRGLKAYRHGKLHQFLTTVEDRLTEFRGAIAEPGLPTHITI